MNRSTPQSSHRPMRDHIRVTPGTRNAAAVMPREQEFDDPKLMTLLQSASKELQGLRLVHLHLSLLENMTTTDIPLIQRHLAEVTANAAHLQMFNMSNNDIIMLYKGLKFSAVEDVCKKIEAQLLAKTKMKGANPYKETTVWSILELSMNFVHVIRWLESITKAEGVAGGPTPRVGGQPPVR